MDSREINSINYDSVFFFLFHLGEISYQPLTISNDADDFKMKIKKSTIEMNVSAVNGFVKSLIVFLFTGNSLKPIHLSAFSGGDVECPVPGWK